MLSERDYWFLARVGKTLWRTENGCKCSICKNTYTNGLKIEDEIHASQLTEIEREMHCRYFDTREDRDAFEQSKNKSDGRI